MAKHFAHEISDYCAAQGIPTIHEEVPSSQAEGIEIRRLRGDISLIRSNLEQQAGPHPDGTCMSDPNSPERKFANRFGCGHPKDPGYTITRRSFLARHYGLEYPELAELMARLSAWEARLPGEFEAVREEYLSMQRAECAEPNRMFADWLDEYAAAIP
jgi:hypothetical protein